MSEYMTYLVDCIRDASDDEQAAALLRLIVKSAAEKAPLPALIEMGQCLVEIRRRDDRLGVERN